MIGNEDDSLNDQSALRTKRRIRIIILITVPIIVITVVVILIVKFTKKKSEEKLKLLGKDKNTTYQNLWNAIKKL